MARQSFYKVTLRIPPDLQDVLIAMIDTEGFLGAENHSDTMIVWLSDVEAVERLKVLVSDEAHPIFSSAQLEQIENVSAEDWLSKWRASIEPVWIGNRFFIVPFADKHPVVFQTGDQYISRTFDSTADERFDTIIIEPKMAFGTGHHTTTQLCLQMLINTVAHGSTWLDIGTGTGLLAIAAVKLGATHVFAFDNDEDAIANAEENVHLNGCSSAISLAVADAFTCDFPSVDGIVANLQLDLLIRLGQKLARTLRHGGSLIVSGVLAEQSPELEEAFEQVGLVSDLKLFSDEWVALRLHHQ